MATRRNTTAFKPKVFIASSTEYVDVARAVQRNFHTEFETKIWDQNVIKVSTYPLESLAKELEVSHFGVFVATRDDFTRSRDKGYSVPRDNVIFELGMFVGRLGHRRTFVVVPAPITKLKLPSDLGSLTLAVYEPNRADKELVAAVGPACDEIRQAIRQYGESIVREVARAKPVGLFSEFGSQFEQLLDQTKSLTVCFIHSRRWRENYNDRIIDFLRKGESVFTAYLPNLDNGHLIKALIEHFDDGPHIPGFIADAYRYFKNLMERFKSKVKVRVFDLYPTYSFYEFDDRILVAMYPLSILRTDVPTLEILRDSAMYEFFATDIQQVRAATKNVSSHVLQAMIVRHMPPTSSQTKKRDLM